MHVLFFRQEVPIQSKGYKKCLHVSCFLLVSSYSRWLSHARQSIMFLFMLTFLYVLTCFLALDHVWM